MLFPADCSEIENEIDKLKLGKSTGLFSIPINLLKTIKMNVSEPLAYIYNWSFSSGTVPNKLKIAQVIPIYKQGSTIDLSNYRPISLLSIFSKLLEKLMYTRLINFFEKNDVLFHGQFGFRANHSTS
jgi:hypothetical protein